MILSDNGKVSCKGTEAQLLAELTSIIGIIHEKLHIDKHFFDECVRIAFLSDEEFDEELAEEEEKMKMATLDAIKQLTDIFGEELIGEFLRDINKNK